MSDVMEKSIAASPPTGTAMAVLIHRKRLEIERDGLRAQQGELAYRSSNGDIAARDELRSIPAKLAGLQFEIDQSHLAHDLAVKHDSDAEIAWRASLQSMSPEDLIEGLNKDECCKRCTPGIEGGCVLSAAAPYSGSTCMHPTRFGTFHQFNVDDSGRRIFPFRGHPQAAKVFAAACDKLKVRGKFA